MLAAGLRPSFHTAATIIHRRHAQARPSLSSVEKTLDQPVPSKGTQGGGPGSSTSNSNSNSNTTSSGQGSRPTTGTNTAPTSVDSKYSQQIPSNNDMETRENNSKTITSVVRRQAPPGPASGSESTLSPIEENALDHLSPTIRTVEQAAAARIFLETYFNDLIAKPSPRYLRRQALEAHLWSRRAELGPAEAEKQRRIFYQRESAHLREMRALKVASTGMQKGLHSSTVDKYEALKVLGKGSFGVVRLVRERSTEAPTRRQSRSGKSVYAMKVIRKSSMLRNNQEGHLRAERDFLVASEGSRWYVSHRLPSAHLERQHDADMELLQDCTAC